MKEYVCGNCEKKFDPDELANLGEALHWKGEPGDVIPYGVCDCGGLVHAHEVKEVTNAVVQSRTGAHFLEGLLKLLSEEQRQELDVTGCVTFNIGKTKEPFFKVPPSHVFAAVDYSGLEQRVATQLKEKPNLNKDVFPVQFEPNFTITKEQLELAAKVSPNLTELLEKQVSQAALEEYARVMNNFIGQQRREWKLKTFGERYGQKIMPPFTGMLKEKP